MLRFFAALLALGCLASSARAHYYPPVRVDFTFRFDVELTDQTPYKKLAPWYTYFPYDPHVHGPTTHFPTWPTPFPPAPAKKDAMSPGGPAAPMAWYPPYRTVSWQPAACYPAPAYPSAIQPVYFQAPSYWYGR
jgi:hypothetical protein